MLFDVDQLGEIQEYLRTDFNVSVDEFEAFLDYKNDILKRERLYKNFTNEDGTFSMERMGVEDKMVLNSLSFAIGKYEGAIEGTPIYNKLVEKYQLDDGLPEFLKEDERTVKEAKKHMKGWYQNSKGDLFHYDGIVWDDVPGESIKDLEFLGD